MKRVVGILGRSVFLILIGGTCYLWLRSHGLADEYVCDAFDYGIATESSLGRIIVELTPLHDSAGNPIAQTTWLGWSTQLPRERGGWHFEFAGFAWRDAYAGGHRIAIPYWAVALFEVSIVALLRYRATRRARAARSGLCPKCGYDLRATPERCPECGTIAAAPHDAAANVTGV